MAHFYISIHIYDKDMGPVNRVCPQDPYLYDRIEVFTSEREVSGKQICR